MRVMVITPEVKAALNKALEQARDEPTPWECIAGLALPINQTTDTLLLLKDRVPGEHFQPPSYTVLIEDGYRVAISFEHQPHGLTKHISVSVDTPGKLPAQEAFVEICKMLGCSFPVERGRVWVEEFEPGRGAINLVEFVGEPHP